MRDGWREGEREGERREDFVRVGSGAENNDNNDIIIIIIIQSVDLRLGANGR